MRFVCKFIRGVPFQDMRAIILEMFCLTNEKNDAHYDTVFQAIFKDKKTPTLLKKIPTFTENVDLLDIIKFHFLNEAGGDV